LALNNVIGLPAAEVLNAMPTPVQPTLDAQRYTWPKLLMTQEQAQALFDDAAARILGWLEDRWKVDTKHNNPTSRFKSFADLPPEAQTVLFDLRYVGLVYRVAHVVKNDPKQTLLEAQSAQFWQDMIANKWNAAVQDLVNLANTELIDQSKSKSQRSDPPNSDYANRFKDGAGLLLAMISQLNL
jgi:hypothetical protein